MSTHGALLFPTVRERLYNLGDSSLSSEAAFHTKGEQKGDLTAVSVLPPLSPG